MQRILIVVVLTLSGFVQAQDVSKSRTSSYYTQIYKITNHEAALYLKKGARAVNESFFHSLVESYPSDSSFTKRLPAGHYLHVNTEADELEISLKSIDNLSMSILNNSTDLMLMFRDNSGEEVKTVDVSIQHKTITYDEILKVFRLAKTNKQGLVEATYFGHTNFFDVNRKYNNTLPVRIKRKALYTFGLWHLISPFVYTYRTVKNLVTNSYVSPPGIYYKSQRWFGDKTFGGFAVINKPMFKPGDTLHYKAFITNRKGKPVSREVEIFLDGYNPYVHKKIGTLSPYRDGAYIFDFVLTDSLKLTLDKNYTLSLHDKRDNHYPSESFNYSQYELNQNFYSLTRAESLQEESAPVLLLKGADSNNLPLYDVRVELVVTSGKLADFYEQQVFLPDTLWQHKLQLESVGETRLQLPDSIFAKARFGYTVNASFLNSENERQVKTLSLTYDYHSKSVIYTKKDSIYFNHVLKGEYEVKGYNHTDIIITSSRGELPYLEKINEAVSYYVLFRDGVETGRKQMSQIDDGVALLAARTSDSVKVTLQNPRKLKVRYQLFKNDRSIHAGSGLNLSLKLATNKNDRYYVALQYIWAGNAKEQNYDLPFAQKELQLSVNHPATIYPGQSVDVDILVKDALGKPVKNADITFFARTRKFKSGDDTQVPNFEKFKNRKAFNSFSQVKISDESISKKLNYDFWKNKLGLDSIGYYQFLYPKNGMFTQTLYSIDSITQVAPYIVKNGAIQSVFYIFFNDELKYYYETATLEPYSFSVDKEVSFIVIRLRDKLITISKPQITNKGKLVLSVDLDNLPEGTRVEEVPDQLQEYEVRKIQRYLMWVRRSEDQVNAYISQGNSYRLFKNNLNHFGSQDELVGPLFPGMITFHSYPEISFPFKPAMTYTFKPALVDRETREVMLSKNLRWIDARVSLHDWVLAERHIKEYFKVIEGMPSPNFRKYPTYSTIGTKQGTLTIRKSSKQNSDSNRYATFLINLDKPDEYFIYPPNENSFSRLSPGTYQIVIIYADEQYTRPAPVKVLSNGNLFYDISETQLIPADAFSKEIIEKVKEWAGKNTYVEQDRMQEMQNIRQLYYQESSLQNLFSGGRWVSGVVTDSEDGSSLPGVNVIVKGTSIGTVTDANGFYRLYMPHESTLVFSFIGLVTDEVEVGSRSQADVQMTADVTQLSEVVVTGYAVSSEKRALAYSVSSVLHGRIAGVTVNGAPGTADTVAIRIRGLAAVQAEKPLVLIDGVIRSFDEIDPAQVRVIEILKSESAAAIYGSRASNGIILISTKPGVTRTQLLETKLPPMPGIQSLLDLNAGSSLRKNFRDYAFWQPALRSNKHGVASFQVTYPDDITGWNLQVMVMADKKKTGQTSLAVQSFKPLAAQLALPAFLIEGDSTIAIGKITNYTAETIEVNKTLSVDDKPVSSTAIELSNSAIDSVHITGNKNRVEVKFQIEYNGYRDGELRTLPVFQAGSKEVSGMFAALTSDTVFTIEGKPCHTLQLYAQSDIVDVLLNEINALKAYPYDCNEQLASKLKAHLAESGVMQLQDKKWDRNKDVEKIIRRLASNQAKNGSWSWWGAEGGNTWITIHIAEALQWAERLGYTVQYDRLSLKEFLMFPRGGNENTMQQLKSWIFLAGLGEKLEVKSLRDSLAKSKNFKSNYVKLLTMRLLQLQGETIDWAWIESLKRKTMKGNLYWGDPTTTMWNNDIDNTLLVYQIKKTRDANDADLLKIRNYFLEVRKKGWRNTYESSRIIETLIPTAQTPTIKYKPELRISGGIDTVVTSFPFQIQGRDLSTLVVSKSGEWPIYFTAYEEKWNPKPEEVSGDFSISSSLVGGQTLIAGQPVELTINLEVKKDAEYVMINVPIPAGCSYAQKSQNRNNGEVHREYDTHETRIYCEKLRAGKYVYKLTLVPRYAGKYQVNPAKAEWMYFPVVYGRTETKKVTVK